MTKMEKEIYGYFEAQKASLRVLPEGGFAITEEVRNAGGHLLYVKDSYVFTEEKGLIRVSFPFDNLVLYGDVENIGKIVDYWHSDEDGYTDYEAY